MIRSTKSAKSISAVNGQHKAGLGKVDYKGCKTEEDFRRRNDEHFAPPDLGWNKASRLKSLRTPAESEVSSDEEGDKQEFPSRKNSPEIIAPRTPESMTPAKSPDSSPSFARQSTMGRIPRTPESFARTDGQSQESVDDGDIVKRLEGLLVTPEEDQEQDKRLGVSGYVRARFEKQAKDRAKKEREEALRAAKERRLTRRDPLRPLVQPLPEEWEERVYAAQRERRPTVELATSVRGTPLSGKDFATVLGHRSWLNDEIINAYLESIEDAANKAAIAEAKAAGVPISEVPKFIAHNSFFYTDLVQKGPAKHERLMRRKKAPGKSFMQVDTMFVPVNNGAHWTVGVVRPVAKTIEYFDSLGGSDKPFIHHLRKWLKFQLGDAYIEDEWKVPGTGCAIQSNSWDCGVFVCTNSFCVAFGLDTSCYIEPDMIQQRRNIAAVLLNRGFVGDFEWGKSGL